MGSGIRNSMIRKYVALFLSISFPSIPYLELECKIVIC